MTNEADLVLESLSRTYPGPVPVHALRPTSLEIRRGQTVGIVGRSGSGKSTLLNLLGLLDRPTRGHYFVSGIDSGAMTESERTALRANYFGFVFQRFHLLSTHTVQENVALSLIYRGESLSGRKRKAAEALERVGMSDRLTAFPSTLSGGESQRVAIARALAQNPRVLLCDEPTGNLDGANAQNIVKLLMEVNEDGFTVIVVTHDLAVAAQLGRTIEIADGQVTSDSAQSGTLTTITKP